MIHAGSPLKKGSELLTGGPLEVASAPKLALVAIDAEKTLLLRCSDSAVTIATFVDVMLQSLHPAGTVAFSIPRPWDVYSRDIRGQYG